MTQSVRYLLLQVRDRGDPMRGHEVRCFVRALQCEPARLHVVDLLATAPESRQLARFDVVLLGGSGRYSAAGAGVWLDRALDALREIHARGQPTFASCWGFQAMARALGGRVEHDPRRAELGTLEVQLTPAGRQDPVFSPLGDTFRALAGHEDRVVELPADAILLASSSRVPNQAYCLPNRSIYCTQFHPELRRADLLARVRAYPEYVERIAGMPYDAFARACTETPQCEALLPRFVRHVIGLR